MTNDSADSEHPALTPGSGPSAASVIAIDGPVASGKSAVGLALSRDLSYRLVDTGMMYRAVTWQALQNGVDLEDEDALVELAQAARIELEQPGLDGITRIRINDNDITSSLRSPEVDRGVSYVSRVPGVRRAMVERQRSLAREGRLIMLGRDIGSIVLPDAPVKIYLDASAKERARRRHRELAENGVQRPESEILEELLQRDAMDTNRHVSPLKPAEDAVIIDTDTLTLEQVIERVREAAAAVQ